MAYASAQMTALAPRHVLPAAMIGIGCVWLVYARIMESRRREHGYQASRYSAFGETSLYGDPDDFYRDDPLPWSDFYETRGREHTRPLHSGRPLAGRASQTVPWRERQLGRLLTEYPIAVAVGAWVAGTAVGLALPATEAESELMAEARETLVARGKGLARSVASRAKAAAGEFAGTVVTRMVGA